MRVLIIGATGSTGLYLIHNLNTDEFKLFATGKKRRDTGILSQKNIEYISLDISKSEEFEKLPKDVDCVVLLAGLMPARMEGYDPYKYIDINITGTLNTLEFCRKNKISKLIFAQSHSDVAGYWNTGEYIKDDAIRKLNYKGDHAVYIISKCAAIDLIEHYHQDFGLQTIVFRLPTIYCYWPDETFFVNGEKKSMAYLTFIKKALKGETIEIWGDPKVSKDIVYIKDFIQLIKSAFRSQSAQGIFNVGTGIPTTLEEQIKGVIEVFCEPDNMSQIVYRPEMPSQISYFYDVSKAQNELDYKVKYRYKEMLEDMKSEMQNTMFELI